MYVVLLAYFAVFVPIHFMIWLRLRRGFQLSFASSYCVAAALGAFLCAPLIGRFLLRMGWQVLGCIITEIGYFWIIIVFWIATISIAWMIWNILVRIAARYVPAAHRWKMTPAGSIKTTTLVVIVLVFLGWKEDQRMELQYLHIKTDKLPGGTMPFRILHLSDIHAGIIGGKRYVRDCIQIARQEKPDAIVITGDLLDGSGDGMNDVIAALADVRPPFGKFAVTGNHEYYSGLANSLALLEKSGCTVLREQSVAIRDGGRELRIAGVDDPAGIHFGDPSLINEDRILPAVHDPVFTILAKHQPIVHRRSLGRFDLQLSGHVHGGQLFPFHLAVKARYGYLSGLIPLQRGASYLYINRGSGTWGPPLRLLAPREATLITIVSSRSANGTRAWTGTLPKGNEPL